MGFRMLRLRALSVFLGSLVVVLAAYAGAAPQEVRAQSALPTGPTPWAVLMCKFSDVAAQPRPQAFFDTMFTSVGAGSMGLFDYWSTNSNGTISLAGTTTFDWQTMPLSLATATSTGVSRFGLVKACIDTHDPSINFATTTFSGIIAILNAPIDSGSNGQVALSMDGVTRTYGLVNLDPLAWDVTFAAHEMGHGYGLNHSFAANSPACSRGAQPGEFCDRWDIMSALPVFSFPDPTFCNTAGQCPTGPSLSAAYRDLLGWIPSNRRIGLNSLSGGSTLVKLVGTETPQVPGNMLAKVAWGWSSHYDAIEFRRKVRWDQGIPRDTVQVRHMFNGVSTLQEASPGVFEFLPGDRLFNTSENVGIAVLGIDSPSSSATVRIGALPSGMVNTSTSTTPSANAAGWRNANATVNLSTSGAGVKSITFSASGGNPIQTTTATGSSTSINITQEGTTKLVFSALAASDDWEAPKTLTVKVDKTAPLTSPSVQSQWNGQQDITLDAFDQLSGVDSIQFQASGANPIPLTTVTGAQAKLTITAAGSTTVNFWAIDKAGNVEGPHSLTVKPIAQFSPTLLSISADVNTTGTQSVMLRNIGQTALPITSLTVVDATGAASPVFQPVLNGGRPCNSPIYPSDWCMIDVVFSPYIAGTYSGRLRLNGSDVVSVIGYGIGQPKATLSSSSLSFGNVRLGSPASQSLAVKNDGTGTLNISSITTSGDFQAPPAGTCASIAVGQSCTLSVGFAPTTIGQANATLTIAHNGLGGSSTVALDAVGVQPTVSLSPSSISFGTLNLGERSAEQTATLTQTTQFGVEVLVLDFPRIVGANPSDFVLTNQSCTPKPAPLSPGSTLEPGAVCRFDVVFRPTAAGPRSATLRLGLDAANAPHEVQLSGTANAPAPSVSLSPSKVNFGSQSLGSASYETITLTNTGTVDLHIQRAALPRSIRWDGFGIEKDGCSGGVIPSGQSCEVEISFSPPDYGTWQTALEFYDDANGSPQQLPLSGEGGEAM